ncbi:MAG: RNA 3'-terminal phosphate cyclase [Candidatus Methylarchaceae archaeon HK02M2]|nr:RNA 3'-terminal phosphate cyclase [Candidatus Methylarchaceae archaeon HK02M2]
MRTSIALSAIMDIPVKIINIRANRANPGLRLQHIGAIKAIASLCKASVDNLKIGADKVSFIPSKMHSTSIKLDIGSAGSITLLLQAVIPSVSLSNINAELEIVGGTDVRWSPTMNYFTRVVLPIYELLGIDVELQVKRRGYYPKGGGIVGVKIKPSKEPKALNLISSKNPLPSIISICSKLPRSVAERQMKAAKKYLANQGIEVKTFETGIEDSISPGSSILIYSMGKQGPFLGSDAIGVKGKPSEKVGRDAAKLFLSEYLSNAPIDGHLGDMIVPFLPFIKGQSRFKVSRVTSHLTSNLYVASIFTKCQYSIDEMPDNTAIVCIKSI